MKLDITEFVMLAGTELSITMIRNRITVKPDLIDTVMDFAEEMCVGFYHVRMDPNSFSYVYFENPIDRDNILALCQKIESKDPTDSKYH